MTFSHPQILWLLLLLPPAMMVFLWWSGRVRRKLMARFIQGRLLPGLIAGVSAGRQRAAAACLVLAVALLIVALARPQWGYELDEVTQRGLDIVVAIDTSKSMLAADIAPNRLTRAKLAALDLMREARSDRLGLVAFAGSAFLQCPLTIDDAAFRQSVEALDVNTLPDGGTALAGAIQTALKAFKEEDNYKVLVLFSDGEDHDPGALDAAKKAAAAGMRIFTVGIGSPEGEILFIRGADGRTNYVRDPEGSVVKSHLNETLLQDIAKATAGGLYLPLRGANTIDVLYQRCLAPLPKTEARERWTRRPIERYHWPLSLAIALMILELFVPERKHKSARASATAPAPARTAAAGAALAILLLPLAAQGSPASALRAYRDGKYYQALLEYQRLIEAAVGKNTQAESLEDFLKKHEQAGSEAEDAQLKQYLEKAVAGTGRLNFNAGAAAYKAGDLDNAESHFRLATADPDWRLQEKAYYNLGNTRYQSGEQTLDPQEKISRWEKAIESYKAALAIDPTDADAKHNREFVEKRLEELKKQQQQQNQQPQDQKQDPKQDQQQDQQQDQKKDQPKQNQQNEEKQSDQQKSDSPQRQAKNDQPPEQEKNEPRRSESTPSQEQKDQQQKPQDQPRPSSGSQNKADQADQPPPSGQASAPGQMTPDQARQLLDAQKGDETVLPARPEGRASLRRGTFKDW